MKTSTRVRALLALLAVSSLASAQQAKTPATPASSTGPAPATVPVASTPRMEPILLHVSGLTKDNQSQVKETLNGLGRQHYVCSTCKHEQALPGKCPLCGTELKSEMRSAFASVVLAPEASSITLIPASGAMVRLSEVERTLTRNSVKVDEGRLTLPGRATLVLKEGAANSVPQVEKALKDAKLFDDVHARYDTILHELEVDVRAGSAAPTRSAVAKAVEGSGAKARLDDVIWGLGARKA